MTLLSTLVNAIIVSILVTALLVSLVVVMYLLKIMLTELFDGYGVKEFIEWLQKNIGATALKKRKTK